MPSFFSCSVLFQISMEWVCTFITIWALDLLNHWWFIHVSIMSISFELRMLIYENKHLSYCLIHDWPRFIWISCVFFIAILVHSYWSASAFTQPKWGNGVLHKKRTWSLPSARMEGTWAFELPLLLSLDATSLKAPKQPQYYIRICWYNGLDRFLLHAKLKILEPKFRTT